MDRAHHRRGRRPVAPILIASVLFGLGAGSGCHHRIVRQGEVDVRAVAAQAERVSAARGLPFLRPVTVGLAEERELRSLARAEARQDAGRSAARARLLSHLSLLPAGSDAGAARQAILESQPAGFYLAGADRLQLVRRPTVRGEILEVAGAFTGRDLVFGEIVGHELAHALQDQHFGLERPPSDPPSQDAELAWAALVEGDALLASFALGPGALFFDEEGFLRFAAKNAPALGEDLPAFEEERFKFPYLSGGNFALFLRRRGGTEALDRAFERPPLSSAEILAPERYLSGAAPRLPDLDGIDYGVFPLTPAIFETLGVFGIQFLVDTPDPQALAASWVGDRAALLDAPAGDRTAVLWVSDWTTPAAAVAVFDGLAMRLERRMGPPTEAEAERLAWTRPEGTLRLEVSGERVVWLDDSAGDDGYGLWNAAYRAPARVLSSPIFKKPEGEPMAVSDAVRAEPSAAPASPGPEPLLRLAGEGAEASFQSVLDVRFRQAELDGSSGATVAALKARLRGHITRAIDLGLAVQLECNGIDDLLEDAYLSFSPVSPQLLYLGNFRAGRFRVPFAFERGLAEELRMLGWLSLPERELAPDRRAGMGYQLDLSRYRVPLRLDLGLHEGEPAGAGQGPLFAARFSLEPLRLRARLFVRAGLGVLYERNHQADSGERRPLLAVAADAGLGLHPFSLEAEALWFDRAAGGGAEAHGFSVTAGVELLPEFMRVLFRYAELSLPGSALRREYGLGAHLFYFGQRFRLSYFLLAPRASSQPEAFYHQVSFQAVL